MSNRSEITLTSALFFGALVMGSTELIAVGLVPAYADRGDFSLAQAGGAVGLYAVGMFALGPALTTASTRLGNRTVLLAACALFVGGALLTVVPSLAALYGGRLIGGTAQGLFLAAAFELLELTVPVRQRGRRIAQVLAGISVAAAIGLPAGSAVAAYLGVVPLTVAVAVLVAGLGLALLRLAPVVDRPPASPGGSLSTALRPDVSLRLLALALTFLGAFTVVTQLAFVTAEHGISDGMLPWVLFGFGLGAVAGTFTGGRLADPRHAPVLAALPLVSASALLLYLVADSVVVFALVSFVVALATFAVVPPVQAHLTGLGHLGGRLLSSLPAAAINVGIAAGSLAAGRAIDFGADGPAWASVVPAAAAAPVLFGAVAAARRRVRAADHS